MSWLATIFGTVLFSGIGLFLLIPIARRDLNQRSLIPLTLRCALAVCLLSWTFFAVASHNGAAVGALPAVYLLLLGIMRSRVLDVSEIAVFAAQPALFAVVFICVSRTQTLAGQPNVTALPQLRLWREVASIAGLCLLVYGLRWLYWRIGSPY
jgi:hypothetical protein